jgi:hypothetical protein
MADVPPDISTDGVYQQLRALTSWALEGKEKADRQSWLDAPEAFAHLFDELDRRLTSGEPLPDTAQNSRTPDEGQGSGEVGLDFEA